jgi:hypothetical protein
MCDQFSHAFGALCVHAQKAGAHIFASSRQHYNQKAIQLYVHVDVMLVQGMQMEMRWIFMSNKLLPHRPAELQHVPWRERVNEAAWKFCTGTLM